MILIFDLDGTLTDPRAGITRCFSHALERLQLPVPPLQELEQFIGPPMREVFTTLLGGSEKVERAVEVFRERYATVGAFECEVFPGIEATLTRLQGRAEALYVATSKPHAYATPILRHFKLARFFRGIYGCELNGERSDKSELLRHLLSEERLRPSRDIVMIGDRRHDIAAARATGLASIGVTWGFGSEEELREAEPDRICRSLDELEAAVETLCSGARTTP